MPFTGFNLKYPEYEVITPQTHLSFHVRSLNVQEEEKLKGSLVTPVKVTEHLNKCLYEAVVKKPESIKDFTTFLKNVTLKDRDALLYGLFHITYEEIRNYDVRCGACAKDYSVTVAASSTFSFNAYPGKDILKKIEKVPLKVSKGVTTYIKQPTLMDEVEALQELSIAPGSNLDVITETLIIDKFEQDIPDQTEPYVVKDRGDIIDAYLSLPAKDKRDIHQEYLEKFGKYGVDLRMKCNCTNCGTEEVIDIDIVTNFFRMVFTA